MKYTLVQTFKKGDRVCSFCSLRSWRGNLNFSPCWFTATDLDVEEFSGKNDWYVMLENNDENLSSKNYVWRQKIFLPEDFEGSGQYIIKEGLSKKLFPSIENTGYLSTIMYKVGYYLDEKRRSLLISMSDGLIIDGYIINKNQRGEPLGIFDWKKVYFSGNTILEAKEKLCDYLNNNPYGETFRFATLEEVSRVIAHQYPYRCK